MRSRIFARGCLTTALAALLVAGQGAASVERVAGQEEAQLEGSAQAAQEPGGSPAPPAALSARNANYDIDVRLDTERKILDGREILTWTNTTEHPAPDLQFHLYYNAWRNTESSFLRSVRYRSRDFTDRGDDEWAYSDVKLVQLLGDSGSAEKQPAEAPEGQPATVLVPEFIQPDDGNPHDRTVMRVTLPEPVAPGATVRVAIHWEAKVPRTFARTGTIADYYFLAQWFPKVGVFEADGTWNCHQFIQTEFYADFGVYDVRMTVPTGWVLGATGKEVQVRDNGDGTSTHQFVQEDVHDFTWTTSPYFTVHESRFEEPGLPPVDMRLLLMPDHADRVERYFNATRAALKYYGTWWGAYPYDHVTVVDPAYQSRTGGMEYPTLFTGGTRWLSPPPMRSPEGVTVHEAGHQFWYGIVANNEFENAWMDEGFDTYSTTRTMEVAYPNPVLTQRYFEGFLPVVFPSVPMTERTIGADAYGGFHTELKLDPMSTPSWRYGPGAYGLNSYGKPGMMLRTLENMLGWETFQKVMSTYYQRWKFRHPKPEDFFAVVNEVSGQDLGWYFAQTYDSSDVFDYAVESVDSRPVRSPRGYVESEGGLAFAPGEAGEEDESDEAAQYDSTVIVRRWGEAIFPVQIEIAFADGETVREQWDGRSRWARFDYTRPAKVETVRVDPEHKLTLDVDFTNNSWTRQPEARFASRKWASKWMIWVQSMLEFFSFLS